MEEFILRIGANATALRSELQRAGAYARAWGTTLAEDFKGKIGRMFAAGFVLDKTLEFFDRVKEKIQAIHRAEGELPGAGANFIQGIFNYVEQQGLDFETISKPILKFKQILDAAARNPGSQQLQSLERYGIVSSQAELKTQKLALSVAKLSKAYLDSGKNLDVLNELVGKASLNPAFLALLEKGPQQIEALGNGNFFTKISAGNIAALNDLISGTKTVGQATVSILGNVGGFLLRFNPVSIFSRMMGLMAGAGPNTTFKQRWQMTKDAFLGRDQQEEAAQAAQESLKNETDRADIQSKFNELKERELELTAQIADIGKPSLEQMEATARRLTGVKAPIHTMTPRLRQALNIRTLEEKAEIATERGQDALHDQLMKQALALRAQSPWLTDKDRDPLRKVHVELQTVNEQLKPVAEMATMANKEATK